eukprot:gene4207-8378_t
MNLSDNSSAECKVKEDEGSNFGEDIFFKIGESLYNQDMDTSSKEQNEPKILPDIKQTPQVAKGFSDKYFLYLFATASCVSILGNIIQYRYHISDGMIVNTWRQRYDEELLIRNDLETRLNKSKQTYCYNETRNDYIIDNCWLRTQLGDCSKELLEVATDDIQALAEGIDYHIVSSVVDVIYAVGSDISSTADGISRTLSDVVTVIESDMESTACKLEEQLIITIDTMNSHIRNTTVLITDVVNQGIVNLQNFFMDINE